MASDHEHGPSFPFTMRFKTRELEAGFSSSKKDLLVRRMKGLAAMHLFVSLCPLAFIFAVQKYVGESVLTDAAVESNRVHAAGQGFMAFFMFLVLGTSPLWGPSCSTPALEVFAIFTGILSMSVNTFTGPRRFARLRGNDLLDTYGDDYDSDSSILLILDIFVTATHLGLPVRWFVMAPLELAALLLYGLVIFVVGSAEPATDVLYNALALCCLVTCSALGKRTAEREERKGFLALISEKALRCQAEYQLSHAAAKVPGEESSISEGTVTDRSGAIFEPFFEQGGDCIENLRVVAEKGNSEHWLIRASELKLLREEALGSGSFGSVQRGIFCGMLVAVKRPHLQLGQLRMPQLCNELRVLRHLRHPHIVATHGAVILPEQKLVCLVLELIDGVDLRGFLLPAGEKPSVFMRYQVMHGVCQALVYMHTRTPHLVHGDLKDSNVLVTLVNGCAFPKVLDFGLSRVVHGRHSRALGGTLAWMAPEVLDRAPAQCSADVYSFGHVLSFAATGTPPSQGRRWQTRECTVWQDWVFRGLQPLVQACLQQQQELRPCIVRVQAELLGLAASLPLRGSSEQASEMKKVLEEKRAHCSTYLQELEIIAETLQAKASMELLEPASREAKLGVLGSLPEEEVLGAHAQKESL